MRILIIMSKEITLTEGSDFTMTALMHHLNNEYKAKRSGELFNIRDIQQYIIKRRIPKIYGGQKIEVVNNEQMGLKIFRLS